MHQPAALSTARESLSRTLPANVGEIERAMSALAGVAMLGYAWKRGSKSLALMSTGLMLRGFTGYCPAYAALEVDHTGGTARSGSPKLGLAADTAATGQVATRIEGV